MTLYLKYRPKNLDELDLKSVSESLKKILSQKEIPHAFLFSGPKGTGKTSAARIVAKVINCMDLKEITPCDKCEQCTSITKGSNLDVIEMDAASHRGIEDIRILRDAVKLAPVSGKKKIYIIDEAHMLTTEASNALLKTLEEPPKHVIFILATTNPEKLIDTIRSRTTLIAFNKATVDEITNSLKRVAKAEKIEITDDGLKIIAKVADGAFRDGIKILEQVTSENLNLNQKSLEEYLFHSKDYDLVKFINLVIDKEIKKALTEIENMMQKGVEIENFCKLFMSYLQKSLLAKNGIASGPEGLRPGGVTDEMPNLSQDDLIKLSELLNVAYSQIPESPIESLPLEIAIIKWVGEKEGGSDKEDPEIKKDEPAPAELKVETSNPNDMLLINNETWKNILALVKPVNASVEALLRSSKPISYDGKSLTLGVFYKFHKERLENAQYRKLVEDMAEKVLHSPTRVCCTLVDLPPKKIIEEVKVETVLTEGKDPDIIKAAEEIFSN